MWTSDPGYSNTVSRAWTHQVECTPMHRAVTKLKWCKKKLKRWSRQHFRNVKNQIKKTKELLWKAEEESIRTENIQEVDRLKTELNKLCEKEENMWHQRSRVQWIKDGDKNTKFFHGTAAQRKQQNFIKGLKDNEGVWQTEEGIVSKMLIDFYSELFTSSSPQNFESILDRV
nr:uncharacterized protein LOC112033027 [Quercus suber]